MIDLNEFKLRPEMMELDSIHGLNAACYKDKFTRLLDKYLVHVLEEKNLPVFVYCWSAYNRDLPLATKAIDNIKSGSVVRKLMRMRVEKTIEHCDIQSNRLSSMDVHLILHYVRQRFFGTPNSKDQIDMYLRTCNLSTFNTHVLYYRLTSIQPTLAQVVRRRARKDWKIHLPPVQSTYLDDYIQRASLVNSAIKSGKIDLITEAVLHIEPVFVPRLLPCLTEYFDQLLPVLVSRFSNWKYSYDIYHASLFLANTNRVRLINAIHDQKLLTRLFYLAAMNPDDLLLTSLLNKPDLIISTRGFESVSVVLRRSVNKALCTLLAPKISHHPVVSEPHAATVIISLLEEAYTGEYVHHGWTTAEFGELLCTVLSDVMPLLSNNYGYFGENEGALYQNFLKLFGPSFVYLLCRYLEPRKIADEMESTGLDPIAFFDPEGETRSYYLAKLFDDVRILENASFAFDWALAKRTRHFINIVGMINSFDLFYTDPETGLLLIEAIDRSTSEGKQAAVTLVRRQLEAWNDLDQVILFYMAVMNHKDIFSNIACFLYLWKHQTAQKLRELKKKF